MFRRNRIKFYIQNKRGYALVLVLILIVVMSVFALGVLATTATSIKQSSTERDYQGVYYIAEAGAMLKLEQIEKVINELNEEIKNGIYSDKLEVKDYFKMLESKPAFKKEIFGEDYFKTEAKAEVEEIELIDDSNENFREYKLISKGKIGERTRTVEQTFKVTFHKPISNSNESILKTNFAVHSNGTIKINGSAKIIGDVATKLSKSQNPISGTINGEKIFDVEIAEMPSFPTDFDKKGNLLKNFGFKKLQKDNEFGYYGKIELHNKDTLQIDVGDSYRELVVDELILGHKDSRLEIVGSGLLIIYVNKELSLNGRIYNVDTKFNKDNAQVVILYEGKNTYIHSGSGNKGKDDFNALIIAPNSEIKLSGNFQINGSIIAKSIEMSGSSTINYKPIDASKIPPKLLGKKNNDETESSSGFEVSPGFIREQ